MSSKTKCLVVALILIVTSAQVLADRNTYPNISDVDRLLKEKRTDYNVYLRPKINQSEPVVIDMAFDLVAIRDFDEVKEKFSVVGTIYMIWTDEKMAWDPQDYGNLATFITEHGEFWVPTLVLINAFEKYEKVGKDDYWPVRFFSDGNALYQPGQVFTTTCSVNVELYPFDSQTCGLFFSVWGHYDNEIVLQSFENRKKVYQNYYSSNGEWDLVDTYAGIIAPNLFRFDFVIKRKPYFIVINTLIPIVIMSFLNILAFLIPIDSGERLSYCITVLLAVAVFLTIIGDSLPQSATTIAVLCYYLVCILSLSMLIIVCTIFSMRIHHRNVDIKVPGCWTRFVDLIMCRICRNRKQASYEKQKHLNGKLVNGYSSSLAGQLELNKTQSSKKSNLNYRNVNTIFPDSPLFSVYEATNLPDTTDTHSVLEEGETLDFEEDCSKQTDGHTSSWKDVSAALDLVFFIVSFIALISFNAVFFVYTMNSRDRNKN